MLTDTDCNGILNVACHFTSNFLFWCIFVSSNFDIFYCMFPFHRQKKMTRFYLVASSIFDLTCMNAANMNTRFQHLLVIERPGTQTSIVNQPFYLFIYFMQSQSKIWFHVILVHNTLYICRFNNIFLTERKCKVFRINRQKKYFQILVK